MLRECSLVVVSLEDFPAGGAHETWGRSLTVSSHLAHLGSGDEVEVLLNAAGATEELHLLVNSIICGDLEGKHLNTIKHSLAVDEELLTVPDVVKISAFLNWVLDTGGVTTGDEVGNSAVDTGRGVPHDLGGATVVHGGWPDGEDSVLWGEGSVTEESGVLGHTVGEGNIVILAPATERMEEEDWVSVALSDKLFTGVLEEEHVAIMERVSHLEGVDDISILLDDGGLDLLGGESVLVITVVEDGSADEAHGVTRDEEVSLGEDGLGLRVLLRHAAEGTGADLFLAVVEEYWVLDDSEDGVRADGGALDGNLGLALEGGLLLSSHRLSDGDREEMALALTVGDGLHVHDLEELELVHESLKRGGPAVTNSLEVLDLVLVNVQNWEAGEFGGLISGGIAPHGLSDNTDVVVVEDTLSGHVVDDLGLTSIEAERTSVDVESGASGSLIRVRDTGELWDDTSAGLGIESLDITALTDFEGSADVALVEFETSSLVDLLGEISVSGVWADEGDEDDLTGKAEELGDFGNTTDVLGTVFLGEAEVLVEASSDDIAIEEEDLLVVTDESVDLLLESAGEGGLASTRETSEPVSGTSGDGVGGLSSRGLSFDHLD